MPAAAEAGGRKTKRRNREATAMDLEYDVEAIVNYHCKTGENPLWDDRRKAVYWEDIPAGRLFRYDVRTGRHGEFYHDGQIGGFTIQESSDSGPLSLLLFGENRIWTLDEDGTERQIACDIDEMPRFNDVIADPAGCVFAGTMGKDSTSGGLYRVDTDGRVTCLFKGTGCANGMCFTPDLKHFYWTCTTTRRIFRFDYDQATGELTNRHVVVAVGPDCGGPDGMTIDTQGNLWSARWGGWGIYKYSPAGEELGRFELPVAKVSSVIFGGDDLDELYVTTAGGAEGAETPDGTLYRVKVGARGLREFRSRVALP